jgi:hypothetical protein
MQSTRTSLPAHQPSRLVRKGRTAAGGRGKDGQRNIGLGYSSSTKAVESHSPWDQTLLAHACHPLRLKLRPSQQILLIPSKKEPRQLLKSSPPAAPQKEHRNHCHPMIVHFPLLVSQTSSNYKHHICTATSTLPANKTPWCLPLKNPPRMPLTNAHPSSSNSPPSMPSCDIGMYRNCGSAYATPQVPKPSSIRTTPFIQRPYTHVRQRNIANQAQTDAIRSQPGTHCTHTARQRETGPFRREGDTHKG